MAHLRSLKCGMLLLDAVTAAPGSADGSRENPYNCVHTTASRRTIYTGPQPIAVSAGYVLVIYCQGADVAINGTACNALCTQ